MRRRPARRRRQARPRARAGKRGVSDLICALGLVLVLEGILYGGMPGLARRLAAQVVAMPEGALRAGGLVAAAAGVALVWLVRG